MSDSGRPFPGQCRRSATPEPIAEDKECNLAAGLRSIESLNGVTNRLHRVERIIDIVYEVAPAAIRRALVAEAEVERLTAELAEARQEIERLKAEVAALAPADY